MDMTATPKMLKNKEVVYVPTNPTSDFENYVRAVENTSHKALNKVVTDSAGVESVVVHLNTGTIFVESSE